MFLLVLAHTGCPRQNPESHKTVVCVYLLERMHYRKLPKKVISTGKDWTKSHFSVLCNQLQSVAVTFLMLCVLLYVMQSFLS